MAASGYPPWTRATGVGFYGVSETLRDYLDLGHPNALDSVTAGEYAALVQASAWMAATAPLLVLRITGDEPNDPPVEAYSMSAGYASYTGDSPPSANFPTVIYSDVGKYTVTVGSTFSDDSAKSGGFTLRFASSSGAETFGASTPYDAQYALVSFAGNTLTWRHRDWATAAATAVVDSVLEVG